MLVPSSDTDTAFTQLGSCGANGVAGRDAGKSAVERTRKNGWRFIANWAGQKVLEESHVHRLIDGGRGEPPRGERETRRREEAPHSLPSVRWAALLFRRRYRRCVEVRASYCPVERNSRRLNPAETLDSTYVTFKLIMSYVKVGDGCSASSWSSFLL